MTQSSSTAPPRAKAAASGDFIAWCIVERPGSAPAWIRCGAAWQNRDGSLSLRLDAVPLSGELHLRERVLPPTKTAPADDVAPAGGSQEPVRTNPDSS